MRNILVVVVMVVLLSMAYVWWDDMIKRLHSITQQDRRSVQTSPHATKAEKHLPPPDVPPPDASKAEKHLLVTGAGCRDMLDGAYNGPDDDRAPASLVCEAEGTAIRDGKRVSWYLVCNMKNPSCMPLKWAHTYEYDFLEGSNECTPGRVGGMEHECIAIHGWPVFSLSGNVTHEARLPYDTIYAVLDRETMMNLN